MTKSVDDLGPLLNALQTELNRLRLWETQPPSVEALASRLPFCCDTLRFTQWLQWVFVARTRALLDAGGSFSLNSSILPMAEQALSGCDWDAGRVLQLIGAIDRTINGMQHRVE